MRYGVIWLHSDVTYYQIIWCYQNNLFVQLHVGNVREIINMFMIKMLMLHQISIICNGYCHPRVVVWWHQAITGNNVDLWSTRPCCIHMKALFHRNCSRHKCVVYLFTISSGNGLPPLWHQAITCINSDLLSIGHSGTKVSKIWIKTQWLSFKEMGKCHLQKICHVVFASMC